MDLFQQSAFTEALGWSLIDSFWQMGVVWISYIIATANGTKFTAGKRHNLALLAVAAGTVWFFVSVVLNYRSVVNAGSLYSLAWMIERGTGNVLYNFEVSAVVAHILSMVYAPMVLFYLSRLLYQLYPGNSLYRKSLWSPDANLRASLDELCNRLKIGKNVTVWLSDKANSPLTAGFWKPIIIMPVAVMSQLSCRQVEAIIAHELIHIKKNDFLLNLLLKLSEAVLFFNPFARLLFNTIRKERENRCDDQVIGMDFDVWEYSEALYVLGRYHTSYAKLSMAATGAGKKLLLQRIRRIMNEANKAPCLIKPVIAFFLCLSAGIFASIQPREPIERVTSLIIKPAVYYVKQTQTFDYPPAPAESKSIRSKKSKRQAPVPVAKKQTEKPPVTEERVRRVIITEDVAVASIFVAAPEIIEFTIIDPKSPEVPEQVVCETPLPYVPRSSFFFTEVDTTAGKKVVEL